MKRLTLPVCGFTLVTLVVLASVSFAAPQTSHLSATSLAGACGETAAATADVPAFLASLGGMKPEATCDITCTQAQIDCRHGCREGGCVTSFFSCDPSNPCAALCSCFCE
jgi:hypothetical protein